LEDFVDVFDAAATPKCSVEKV